MWYKWYKRNRKGKIYKKPYLYQAGIDMVFSIFSSSNFHVKTPMCLGWSRSITTRAHDVADWCDILHKNTTLRAKFPKKNISIPSRYRYGFLANLAFLSIQNSLGTPKKTYWCGSVWILVGQDIFCVKKPYLYQRGIDMVFQVFLHLILFSKSKGALYQGV